jgi:hypothetical protein
VLRVPGHDVKAMASRSSSDQSVACGNDFTGFLCGGCEFSPSVAGFEIDGKDSIRVIAFEGLQPCLEFAFVLAFLKKRNPFGDFPDGYDTDKQTIAFEGFDHTADTGMSLWGGAIRKARRYREKLSKLHISRGRGIAGKIQSFEARASSHKKFLEIRALPGEFFVVTLCYDDDSIIVTADPLWSFGKSAGNEFTEAVFGICKSPFHGGSY